MATYSKRLFFSSAVGADHCRPLRRSRPSTPNELPGVAGALIRAATSTAGSRSRPRHPLALGEVGSAFA